MTVRVGINGIGRIGRNTLRAAIEDPEIELVACNDFSKIDMIAHLLKYDSTQGRLRHEVEVDGLDLIVDGKRIVGLSDRNPENLPWGELGVDVVIESTGHFKTGEQLAAHIKGGAKKVILSAPGTDVDATIVMGVNDDIYNPETMNIVSNASCTTNCLAPVAKVLSDSFGIQSGYMTTIHAFTTDQRILDNSHKDLRRARGAAQNIIPTSTGAARALALVMPELTGKLDGFSARVPVPDGSMVDLVVKLDQKVTKEQVNAAMKEASQGAMKGILEYCTDPVVSSDIVGDPASSVFDADLTMVLGGENDMIKVVSWYDNEWGYSNRLLDLAKKMMA